MPRMWDAGDSPLIPEIENFTVDTDRRIDTVFLRYDAAATRAHAEMLHNLGYLTKSDMAALNHAFDQLEYLIERQELKIGEHDEDCHSTIENFLVRHAGEVGMKVHLFRSRNEQILNAVRLYCIDHICAITESTKRLATLFEEMAEKHENTPLPGYTHTQRAMPTTLALWLSSFAEMLKDDADFLQFVRRRLDRCPLGTGAGFGAPGPVDRQFLAQKLGYGGIQGNPLAAQSARPKETQLYLAALAQIADTCAKFATDCLLFACEEFGFLSLDDRFTTGSSMLPNKRNYDLFELVRAKSARVEAMLAQTHLLARGLISGYHRDFQLLKEPLVRATSDVEETLQVLTLCLPEIRFNEERLKAACADESMRAVHEAVELATKEGIPYRRAYFIIKQKLRRKNAHNKPR